jgi:hypothetical protein
MDRGVPVRNHPRRGQSPGHGTEAALPLRRVPSAADYAPLYTLLASQTASTTTMTGTVLTADSGLSVRDLATS